MKTFVASLVAAAAIGFVTFSPATARADGDDMVVFTGHQTVRAGQEVTGDLVVMGGSADVYGHVDGDAVAIGGRIYVAPQGQVDGSFVTLGGFIDNQSTISHGATHHRAHGPSPPPPPDTSDNSDGTTTTDNAPAPFVNDWSTFMLFDAALVLLAFLLFPVKAREATQYMIENPIIAAIAGVFSPILLALVVTALAITIIGIPIIPIVVILSAIGYLIGKAALAGFLGQRLFDVAHVANPKPVVSLLVGLALLTVVSVMSWEGIVVYWCIAAISLGTAVYGLGRVLNQRRRFTNYIPPGPPPPQPPAAQEFAPPAGPAPTGPPAIP